MSAEAERVAALQAQAAADYAHAQQQAAESAVQCDRARLHAQAAAAARR